ncbi:Cytochrome P450 [Frankia sp. AiPs1]|uniref:cytochrome P450 n=1 Tax=Frankia sp. AiPa1 TaxID=573492 RepID=UPI00202AEFA6|nr:cytochrome P450 [Frankia sp. AiPa1]MCL9761683.1 cytochrome P450 [Frankia sp. AiPa1]
MTATTAQAEQAGPETSDWRFTGILSALAVSSRPDPYPHYHEVREISAFIPGELVGGRILLVTRHAEASAVLAHPAIGHGYREGIAFRGEVTDGLGSLLRADPPDHGRLRRLVGRAFTPSVVATLAAEISATADTLIDEALSHGEVDAVTALTRPLPLRVMCRLLGVPDADEALFGGWADALTRGLDPRPLLSPQENAARAEATIAFEAYFRDLLAQRRAVPREDLLSRLVAIHDEDGDALSTDELLELCTLLLVAGYETTVNLLGAGILALVRNPDALAALRADPTLIGPAVEEMLRFDPPIQVIGRTVLTDTEIGGQALTRGEGLLVMVGAVNRDPAAFDEPDRFQVDRFAGGGRARRHLGFGVGIHYCLGAPLARVEAELVFRALLDRVGSFSLNGDVAFRRQIVIRGVQQLPVRLTA